MLLGDSDGRLRGTLPGGSTVLAPVAGNPVGQGRRHIRFGELRRVYGRERVRNAFLGLQDFAVRAEKPFVILGVHLCKL